jgi:hypothetical protein
MIAALTAALALAVPACHAPECLVQVGPGSGPAAGPLRLDARRTNTRLTVELSRPALLTLRAGGREHDRWLAPAGTSVHLMPAGRRRALRLVAVDGTGDRANCVLPAGAHAPLQSRMNSARTAAVSCMD